MQVNAGPKHPQRILTVHVERPEGCGKPFLGGYRHKHTREEYHHAFMQTVQPASAEKAVCYSREVQTIRTKTRSTQNVRECATQMPRPGLLLDTSGDTIVQCGSYFSSEERERCAMRHLLLTMDLARHTLRCVNGSKEKSCEHMGTPKADIKLGRSSQLSHCAGL
jgi:hypothetical protein